MVSHLPDGASRASLQESQLSPPCSAVFLLEGVLKRQWLCTGRSGHRIQALMISVMICVSSKWCCMKGMTNSLDRMKPIAVFWDLKTPLHTIHILISNRLTDMVTISKARCSSVVVKSAHSGQIGFGWNPDPFTYYLCDLS